MCNAATIIEDNDEMEGFAESAEDLSSKTVPEALEVGNQGSDCSEHSLVDNPSEEFSEHLEQQVGLHIVYGIWYEYKNEFCYQLFGSCMSL